MRNFIFGITFALASALPIGVFAQSSLWPDSFGDSWPDSFGDSFGDSMPFGPWQGWDDYFSRNRRPADGFNFSGFALSEAWFDSVGGLDAQVAGRIRFSYDLTLDGDTRAGIGTYLEGGLTPGFADIDVLPFAYLKSGNHKLTAGYAENALDRIAPTFPWTAGAGTSFKFIYDPLVRYDGRFGDFRVAASYSLDEWASAALSYKSGPLKVYGGFDAEIPTGYVWGEIGGTYRFNDAIKGFARVGSDGTTSEIEVGGKYFFSDRILLTGDIQRYSDPISGGFDISAGLRYGLLRNVILYGEYQGDFPDIGVPTHTALAGLKVSF